MHVYAVVFMSELSGHANEPVRLVLDNNLPVVLARSKTVFGQYTVLGIIRLMVERVTSRLLSPVYLFTVLGYFHFWVGRAGVQRRRT